MHNELLKYDNNFHYVFPSNGRCCIFHVYSRCTCFRKQYFLEQIVHKRVAYKHNLIYDPTIISRIQDTVCYHFASISLLGQVTALSKPASYPILLLYNFKKLNIFVLQPLLTVKKLSAYILGKGLGPKQFARSQSLASYQFVQQFIVINVCVISLFQMKARIIYAMIAVIVMVATLQTTDAKPANCYCQDYGRFCFKRCVTQNCVNACYGRKMRCYRRCGLRKRDGIFNALDDEEFMASVS